MNKKQCTAAAKLIEILKNQGVECIFGLPGGSAIPIFDALAQSDMKLVLTRHEQGATHMADGYARSSGKVGVALVTSGPGATNTLTGIMTAMMDSVPLVVLCGQQLTTNLGLDTFQEADVSGMSYPIVKHSFLVKDPEELPSIINQAFHIAGTGRPGPVIVDLPKDVTSAYIDEDTSGEFSLPGYSIRKEGDPKAIKEAADMISSAEKPILLIGHGAVISGASREVKAIVEKMQIPVCNTLLGKGCFPESHDLNLGMPGMHGTAYANMALCESDLIISVGSRWDDRIAGSPSDFLPQAKKIHIDIDPVEINKTVKVDCAIIGDAKSVLDSLYGYLEKGNTQRWVKLIRRLKREYPLKYKKEGKLRAQHVIEEMSRLTKGEAIVTTDVGQHQMWAAQFFKTEHSRHFLSSGGAGTMGFGFPAAIGAQLANPGKTVVAVVGDGGFQMTLPELSTAVNEKLPIKILLINNNYLGMVRQWQHMFYDNRLSGVDLVGNPDFIKLASAYGCKGFRVKRSADVRKVLNAALEYNDGPCIIDAEVEKYDNVFPMVPSGAGLDKMLLSMPRKKLEKPKGGT
ncbi:MULTISPECIES: biosynthetic-type acetolactate synthase large subunit [unclassified Oceanispirochaeta]|uniref:biosynthetic-type acetolactate synthase large subunit n=1 Tax=unclassified Oceanispirochaeta TaxID=2635722 RepID=UPI000E09BE9C|nr:MULTISPECIES: biosynthetic-type acetolactate synthase large subunit [unclassified Oceanispirochaeta]MBF9014749.1 biosynthetic-type acetolactate synthase large subunit [Oceanispirochaeta sp. M2]NPD71005.1 biosynthetic-type acetolactate synthase large subunit [Oceanispirochaeta sp. M1]RDG33838.1 biosynthetic-type acetolactate synthase large subunit [Oceanispirochaeta sp. M1]